MTQKKKHNKIFLKTPFIVSHLISFSGGHVVLFLTNLPKNEQKQSHPSSCISLSFRERVKTETGLLLLMEGLVTMVVQRGQLGALQVQRGLNFLQELFDEYICADAVSSSPLRAASLPQHCRNTDEVHLLLNTSHNAYLCCFFIQYLRH